MKIYVFGSTGMLGAYISTYLNSVKKNIVELTRNDLDVNNLSHSLINNLFEKLNITKEDIIINCIGIIPQSNSIISTTKCNYYKINAIFPIILNTICEKNGCKFIHITTDCVYSGDKGNYNENDEHDEKNDYGVSKSLGELCTNATIIRTSIIGEEKKNKYSLLEWVIKNKNGHINGYSNHYWNGVTCLQLSKIINKIIDNNLYWNGVRHIFSPKVVSKKDLCTYISNVYNLNIQVNEYDANDNINKSLTTIYKDNSLLNIPDIYNQLIELKNYHL
tara:strand:+ start:1062 stop:1889 length:828 start_codon:yes stop_codon:yes gene_type:complete